MQLTNTSKFLGLAAGLALVGSASGAPIRVNAASPVLGNGSSWGQAMPHLKDALAAAQFGDEIWIAAGTYYPDTTGAHPDGTADRTLSFEMKNGIAIFGGFAGNETVRTQRNAATNRTILSGDIGVPSDHGDNSYSVVRADNVANTAIIDGVTIKFGQANVGTGQVVPNSQGGGIYIVGGAGPVITECRFEDNFAQGGAGISINSTTGTQVQRCTFTRGYGYLRGGGIEILDCLGVLVLDCVFDQNKSYFGGGTYGNFFSEARVERCRFKGNISVNGGAMFQAGFSLMTTVNCWFIQNVAQQLTFYQSSFDGGAIKNWCTSSTFTNCVFVGNAANGRGGVIFDAGPSGSSATLTNCTVYGNWQSDAGTFSAASGHTTTLRNCAVAANAGSLFDGSMAIDRNNFQGVWYTGNTGYVTQFVDPDGPDNTLGTLDDDFRLAQTSPLIDAGSNSYVPAGVTLDILLNSRINDGNGDSTDVVDLGAFEFLQAPPPPCIGDANGDRVVSFADITSVLTNWGFSGPAGDSDTSGIVNFADITSTLTEWGTVCP